MKLICDCFNIENLELYKNSGIKRILVSMPLVSVRPVRVVNENELENLVMKAHELDLEVAVNMLNFMMEDEINSFENALRKCKEVGVDRIYYADMGVYQLAKELGIHSKLIYQPTTLIACSLDANHYLSLGIDKVVLSREITFEEMKHILERCNGCEISVFGYNPMMHSKRRLLSSYFEFTSLCDKSSNENLYLMEESRDEKMPVFQDQTGTHVLSGSIFSMFKEVNQLHGCNFKIEGIHLNEEIVLQAARDIHDIVNGNKDGNVLFEEYMNMYPNIKFSDGFMYKKTSLVKEGC